MPADHGRAGARAAGQLVSPARAEHPQAHMGAVHDLQVARVHPLGKARVALDQRSGLRPTGAVSTLSTSCTAWGLPMEATAIKTEAPEAYSSSASGHFAP